MRREPKKKKQDKSKWRLDRKEVTWGWIGSSSKISGRVKSNWRLYLEHLPTGTKIEGEIPEGFYSKKELTKLRKELKERMYFDLEKRVAKALKINNF